MDPVTAGMFTGLSGAMRVFGALEEGKAAQKAAEQQAAVAEQQAALEGMQGVRREQQVRREATKVQGAARAAAGASGLTATGSVLDTLSSSAGNAELDALTINYDTQLRRNNYLYQAALSRFEGQEAKRQSKAKALGSLIEMGMEAGSAAAGMPVKAGGSAGARRPPSTGRSSNIFMKGDGGGLQL